MDSKLALNQARYKHKSDQTVRSMLQFYPARQDFVDRPVAQMTESARMASAPLTKSLPETLSPFKVASATQATVTPDEIGVQKAVSKEMVKFALYNVRIYDGIARDSDMQNVNRHRDEDRTDKNDARITGEFPVQQIVNHVDRTEG